MFEWDEEKREKNLANHGLDFRDAELIFDGRSAVHAPSYKNDEERLLSVAMIGEKF